MNNEPEKNETTDRLHAKKEYKDSLFRMIFNDTNNLLSLYNAMNGTRYTDESQLEIVTLENAIYATYKNDISFIINATMALYEHQSTINPNIPLRDLFYLSAQLSEYTKDKNLYGTKIIRFPTPKFICFYNGPLTMPARSEWRLSDAFLEPTKEEEKQVELIVKVYNVNIGYNENLMEICKPLHDYSLYVSKVREYAKTMDLNNAVEQAITECIRDDIMAEFLRKNQMEAKAMSIFEYDEEAHKRMERRDWEIEKAEELAKGIAQGIAQVVEASEAKIIEAESKVVEAEKKAVEAESKVIEAEDKVVEAFLLFVETLKELNIQEDQFLNQLMGKYHLSEVEARKYL